MFYLDCKDFRNSEMFFFQLSTYTIHKQVWIVSNINRNHTNINHYICHFPIFPIDFYRGKINKMGIFECLLYSAKLTNMPCLVSSWIFCSSVYLS